jgi:hypothetical protein
MLSARVTLCLFVAVLLHVSIAARADAGGALAAMDWQGPTREGCIDEEALAERVNRQLGRVAVVPLAEAAIVVVGRVESLPGGRFQARITAADKQGHLLGVRTLRSDLPDCRSLDDSFTLVLALLIDPEAAFRAPEKVGEDSAPPSVNAAPNPVQPRSTLPASPAGPDADHTASRIPSSREPWRGEARVAGVLAVGLLPSPAPGARAVVSVAPPHFVPTELGFAAYSYESAVVADGGASFGLIEGSLGLCPTLLRIWRLRGDVCGGVGASAMHAEGTNFSTNKGPYTQLLVALEAEARGVLAVAGPVFVSVGARAVVPFVRPNFFYTDDSQASSTLYRPPPLAGIAEIGIGTRIF